MQFSTYIFSANISPEMLKLGRVTKVKVLFLVLVFVFHFDLFKFSAAILEKGLLILMSGLYIRAGSRRSLLASLPGFESYFHCFTSHDMSRR